jgi:hypothetical protein
MSVTWFLAPDHSDALFRYFQPVFMAEAGLFEKGSDSEPPRTAVIKLALLFPCRRGANLNGT